MDRLFFFFFLRSASNLIYLMPHTLPISNKAKEMHYKIVHGYVATNHLLYKMNIMNSDVCNFCKHCEQTYFMTVIMLRGFG